jgi:arylsulfatase A-like enzyme|tara:strand:- start:189 stop:362 length:174 start_codon:yes stop_codon:yes gene_type:complete
MRPNIILFVTNDQVKEELACYGGKVLTPHIDRLAREGMRYDNAYVRPPFALLLATRC